MNLFEVVKANINTQEVAQTYGIDVNHHGMALCPFHNDRHPSLYVSDDHYHCFACGEHGDVIDLTARLYNLAPKEAAEKLKPYLRRPVVYVWKEGNYELQATSYECFSAS